MSSSSLSEYYANWEKKVAAIEAEAEEMRPPSSSSLGQTPRQSPDAPLDPKKIKYALGKPLTAEEFAEYRRTHTGTRVVGQASM